MIDKVGRIYKHTNKINGYSYIGQTKNSMEKRYNRGSGYRKNHLFHSAIKEFGWKNFTHEIIEDNVPIDKLDEREIYWISYYHTYVGDPECKGYNITKGGNNGEGRICRNETKNKTSNSLKGHYCSPESIKLNSEKHKGKTQTEESRKKISQGNIGKSHFPQGIKCVETGMVFSSLNKAAQYYHRTIVWVKNRLNNPNYFLDDVHFVRINKYD